MDDNTNVRRGNGIAWQMKRKTCYGESIVRGFTIDNLDSKEVEEAKDSFEKIFVIVRKELEKNENRCMDNTNDRLALCQAVSVSLHNNIQVILEEGTGK